MQHVFAKSGLDKRERDELKEGQQRIQAEFEAAQKFQEGLAHFKKEAEGQSQVFNAGYCRAIHRLDCSLSSR